jgi:hypothetical protein
MLALPYQVGDERRNQNSEKYLSKPATNNVVVGLRINAIDHNAGSARNGHIGLAGKLANY